MENIEKLINLINKAEYSKAYDLSYQLLKKDKKSYILHNLQGIVNIHISKYDEAILNFREAIKLNRNFFDPHNNLGQAYFKKGKLDLAIENYKNALSINKNSYIAYTNLAKIYYLRKEFSNSFECLNKSLAIEPGFEESLNLLREFLILRLQFSQANKNLYEPIINLIIKQQLVQPKYIAHSVVNLLKRDNDLVELIYKELNNTHDTQLIEDLSKLSNISLLNKFIRICTLPDIDIENYFKLIRSKILFYDFNEMEYLKVKTFIISLSIQCLLNEFLYEEDESEVSFISDIEKKICENINDGKDDIEVEVVKLSLYRNLVSYSWVDKILKLKINKEFKKIIEELTYEKELSSKIKSFGNLNNGVSKLVKCQYEENPYPRWFKPTILKKGMSINEFVKNLDLNVSDDYEAIEYPEVLIAGCGTGQHAINTASRFSRSNVTAFDLSYNSVSYGLRKSIEHNIDNINFMQGDILNIKKLNKEFDIIECSGVLHHMEKPKDGLRELTGVLRKRGLIKIGLYSSLARRNITKFRNQYLNSGDNIDIKTLKSLRKVIINSSDDNIKNFTKYLDFYSSSEVRDMLFNTQEHTFNINEIEELLFEMGLKFCGFTGFGNTVNKNNDNFDKFNLTNWGSREKENPDMFIGMYQLWCQKN